MITPFDIWAPILKAPFSGDVTQEITPRFLSPDIQGVPEIEQKVQSEVASYGTQLGKVLEALQMLSKATQTPLPEIDALVEQVEAIKADTKDALRTKAETALARLKEADEDAWKELVRQ